MKIFNEISVSKLYIWLSHCAGTKESNLKWADGPVADQREALGNLKIMFPEGSASMFC